ncbi:hypothetical protein QVD17_08545 [Tagetes erecta]|uniref:Uncharacterized protein n=1 Tax=Tagetes erecta TaxID=13708 RepID=A0AAD8NXN0_TARER|nr:hypothetical protein QVD17_08545 [Tagetes erecta]
MCINGWGRSSYARAMVEISADMEFKQTLKVGIPSLEGDSVTVKQVDVEYEWTPPRCSHCKVFGHDTNNCVIMTDKGLGDKKKDVMLENDGFVEVPRKKAAKKHGFNVQQHKPRFEYKPIINKKKGADHGKESGNEVNGESKPNMLNNSFSVLMEKEGDIHKSGVDDHVEKGDGSGVDKLEESEECYDETYNALFVNETVKKGASTPSVQVEDMCGKISKVWRWCSNASSCLVGARGTRIIMGWDTNVVDVHRRSLWESLSVHKGCVKDHPWVMLGDFNSTLNLDDQMAGPSKISLGMKEFRDCVNEIEVVDINASGVKYTWNQKPTSGIGIFKKLDRVMGNAGLIDRFPKASVLFKPYGLSDHSPCILTLLESSKHKPKPFKFTNLLTQKPEFEDIVKKGWECNVNGVPQFRLVKRLKGLKKEFRLLLFKQGHIHEKVVNLRKELEDTQSLIESDPHDGGLREKEAKYLKEFVEASMDEERFVKQKAKVKWLAEGDANTKYFHNILKCKNNKKTILSVLGVDGTVLEGDLMIHEFVNFYEHFLGGEHDRPTLPSMDLFSKRLDEDMASSMVSPMEGGTGADAVQYFFSLECD